MKKLTAKQVERAAKLDRAAALRREAENEQRREAAARWYAAAELDKRRRQAADTAREQGLRVYPRPYKSPGQTPERIHKSRVFDPYFRKRKVEDMLGQVQYKTVKMKREIARLNEELEWRISELESMTPTPEQLIERYLAGELTTFDLEHF